MEKSTSAPVVIREKVKPGIWRRQTAAGKPVYEITYRDSDGRQRRQTVDGGQRVAEGELARVKANMADGKRVAPNPRLTFAQAADEWLEAKAPALTDKTVSSYQYALRVHLLPAFGRSRLDKIDVSAVSRFVARMAKAEYRRSVEARDGGKATATGGYAVETIKSVLIPMSRTFAYAKRHLGYAGDNPVTSLDLDERPGYKQHKKPKRKLGRDELDKLMESSVSPYKEIMATSVALGTRLGETLGLRWSDVDFDTGKIRIEQQANAKRELVKLKTQTAYRRIEAPSWLLKMFAEMKLKADHGSENELIFATRTGQPHGHGNVLARGLYKALDRAGLPRVSFHSLRHTHASLWIKDGGDVVTLSKRLGHATPQITMSTYADEIEEANDDAVRRERVEAMFAGTEMATIAVGSTQQATPKGSGQVIGLPG